MNYDLIKMSQVLLQAIYLLLLSSSLPSPNSKQSLNAQRVVCELMLQRAQLPHHDIQVCLQLKKQKLVGPSFFFGIPYKVRKGTNYM